MISDELENYNTIRLRYQLLARESAQTFHENFNKHFSDMDSLHSTIDKIFRSYLKKPLDQAIRDLVVYGVVDIGEKEFFDTWLAPLLTWQSDFEPIDDKYISIILNAKQFEEYRQERNKQKTEVIGGGFGVEGAAAGIAVATAANLALGILRGVGNVTEKAFRALGDAHKKSQLFNDLNTKKVLVNSIEKQILFIHLALIKVLEQRKIWPQHKYEFISTINNPSGIIENIKKNRIPEDKIQESLVSAIHATPYQSDAYLLWIDKYGDEGNQLFSIANYFGIQILDEYKQKLLQKDISVVDYESPESFLGSLKKVEARIISLGLSEATEIKERLLTNYISKLESTLDFSTRQSFDENIKKMENDAKIIGFSGLETIKERLDKKLRTYDGLVYETDEQKKVAQRDGEYAKSIKELDFLLGTIIFFTAWPVVFVWYQRYTTESRVIATVLAGISFYVYRHMWLPDDKPFFAIISFLILGAILLAGRSIILKIRGWLKEPSKSSTTTQANKSYNRTHSKSDYDMDEYIKEFGSITMVRDRMARMIGEDAVEEIVSVLDNKVGAIKRYRDLTGHGLAESKEAIESLMREISASGK